MEDADVVVDEHAFIGCTPLTHHADEGEVAGDHVSKLALITGGAILTR